jgi:hypothetical protein
MRVLIDSFSMFKDWGFLAAVAILMALEAAFAGLMLVLTKT